MTIGNSQFTTGFGKTSQDLIVTGFGMATSSLTALVLALVETKLGFAFYSFMWWFVIPAGALLSGFAAASGYYLGARIFHHRPTRLMLFNMISVAITTYFLLNYLNYSFTEIKGQSLSELIPFGQYLDFVVGHQSMEFRVRGAKLGSTGELGSFGYAVAALQVLGFAVGGLCVFRHLRSVPYCRACEKYLKQHSSVTRYTNDAPQIEELYSDLAAEFQTGNSARASRLITSFGASKPKDMKLNVALTLWKCRQCPQEFFVSSINRWDGKNWRLISGFSDYIVAPMDASLVKSCAQ